MRCRMKYRVILHRVVTARDNMYVGTCICVQSIPTSQSYTCAYFLHKLLRLSMTSLICIDSAYDVACHKYNTRPPQGRARVDCLMN